MSNNYWIMDPNATNASGPLPKWLFPLKESRYHSFSLSGLSLHQPFNTNRPPDRSVWDHPQHKARHTAALDKGLSKGSWLCTLTTARTSPRQKLTTLHCKPHFLICSHHSPVGAFGPHAPHLPLPFLHNVPLQHQSLIG